ncbi:MAG TPA: DUF1592 domain-containing protein [Verrucomicrobiae bacterium]|nr:DUF1592 domain-containing protein [Verrucomicrobiae bacterium]
MPFSSCITARFVVPRLLLLPALLGLLFPIHLARASNEFESKIKPILSEYCYDCHGDGMKKGNVELDAFKSDADCASATDVWFRVLKNLRAGIMPPEKKPHPSPEQIQTIATFVKRTVFSIDANNPDPGRVTIRRLNRVEYRNTIRDLMGIDFNTEEEFPPDDSGYGFDNIGDVLTISPMLLEKYLQAAEKIVTDAVPTVPKVMPEKTITGKQFDGSDSSGDQISLYEKQTLTNTVKIEHEGDYRLALALNIRGSFNFNPARAKVTFRIDGEEKEQKEFGWDSNKKFEYDYAEHWKAGNHQLAFEIQPLKEKEKEPEPQQEIGAKDGDKKENTRKPVKTFVNLHIDTLKISGPLDQKYWIKPKNYDRFFFKETPPAGAAERKAYAHEILAGFAKKAFRRPADEKIVSRLTEIAEQTYSEPGKTFERGIAQAMVATLATPRFLFRVEDTLDKNAKFADVDEYALASRLSYFLWSTMPDDRLFDLARKGELRKNLKSEVKRMLEDERSKQFVDNFTGQWLEVRDVAGIAINERAVFARENTEPRKPDEGRRRFFGAQPKVELDGELRRAMQNETRMYFSYILKEDRSIVEMLDSDYTFANARLAKVYGLPEVEGKELRKVTVPEDSPRGGMLTQGSVLVVTSNPTRTSPVKRGLFLLDNFLGSPPPPPPADLPPLEDSEKGFTNREPTLRETLEIHRAKPLCASCHDRMDPLGLAFENFNALGLWRDQEHAQKIDPAGKLLTGETFSNIKELKKILATKRHTDFYRCLTEKLLIYALGRGLEYYDVAAVDRIVDGLEKDNGRFSTLITGVIESAPFEKRRNTPDTNKAAAQRVATKD